MHLKIILSVLALFSIAFLVPSDAFGAWYDTEWEYRNKITVSLNSVISNDLSDFPVLIKFTHNDLKQANESEGRDFVFTLSDGTTKLSHEIEHYDNTTGEIIAWVNFPTLAAASSTDIYIYYKGNTVGFNSADVWNDDYVLVWHLNQTSDGTAGEFSDATGNGNDGRGGGGTKVGYNAARIPHLADGQIGNGQEFKGPTTTGSGEGTGDMIWTNSVIQGMPSRDVTIELWVGDITNSPGGGNLYNDMVSFCTTHTSIVHNNWSNHLVLWKAKDIVMAAKRQHYVGASGVNVEGNNAASFTNWNHIVAVYNMKDADGTVGASNLYVNGVLAVSQTGSQSDNVVLQTTDLRMVLGGDIDGASGNNCNRVNNELKGKVDELRISSGLKTADYAAATYFNQGDPSTYLSLGTQETQDEEEKNSTYCWDCEAPKLTKAEVLITSQNSETQHISQSSDIWNFDHNYPLFAIDDYKTPIIADPGDKVEIILELTDNRSLKGISDSGTYTNFMNLPKDMNLFYANNFDKFGKVSTTFYEWHQTGDDLVYDYSKSTEWTEPSIVIEEISTYQKDIPGVNLDGIVGTFTITYKIKFLEPMQTTEVWVYAADEYGNFFKLPLPFTLKIAGNEPLVFESNVNQKVLGFYDESMLLDVVSDWTGSSQDVSDLAKILGIPDEQIPPWVTNLAVWVSEDKISMGDMIVSIEHLINN